MGTMITRGTAPPRCLPRSTCSEAARLPVATDPEVIFAASKVCLEVEAIQSDSDDFPAGRSIQRAVCRDAAKRGSPASVDCPIHQNGHTGRGGRDKPRAG